MARQLKTFTTAHPKSRVAYEEYLNELGIPGDDKWSNGGRIPASTIHYGTWLRLNDPITFNVGWDEWKIDKQ